MAHLVIYVEEALARAVELLLGSGFDGRYPDWARDPDWKPGRNGRVTDGPGHVSRLEMGGFN